MDIVQLSNLFNLIAQAHPKFNSYHFGWRSDVNASIQNNFDPAGEIGKQYPAVHFDAAIDGNSVLTTRNAAIDIRLHFDDILYYGMDGATDTRTLIEVWRDLWGWGMQFVYEIRNHGKALSSTPGMMVAIAGDSIRWYYDSNRHNDRVATVYFEFTLAMKIDCVELGLELDGIDGFPFPPEGWDYEDEGHKTDSDGDLG